MLHMYIHMYIWKPSNVLLTLVSSPDCHALQVKDSCFKFLVQAQKSFPLKTDIRYNERRLMLVPRIWSNCSRTSFTSRVWWSGDGTNETHAWNARVLKASIPQIPSAEVYNTTLCFYCYNTIVCLTHAFSY